LNRQSEQQTSIFMTSAGKAKKKSTKLSFLTLVSAESGDKIKKKIIQRKRE
jgi:hypothetical protein